MIWLFAHSFILLAPTPTYKTVQIIERSAINRFVRWLSIRSNQFPPSLSVGATHTNPLPFAQLHSSFSDLLCVSAAFPFSSICEFWSFRRPVSKSYLQFRCSHLLCCSTSGDRNQ